HTRSKRDWSSDVCSSDLSVRRFDNGHVVVAEHHFKVGVSSPVLKYFATKVHGRCLEFGLTTVIVRVEEIIGSDSRVCQKRNDSLLLLVEPFVRLNLSR